VDHAWTCACCGKQYNTLPEGFACEAPHYWRQPADDEPESRNELGSDFCMIDGEEFFIRGCVEIPVIGRQTSFIWGVWASLSRESFERAVALHDQDIIENEPPRFGWFSNELSVYPSTLSLKTQVHFRSHRLRPSIVLESTDHPLAVEQRQGISVERVQEIAAALFHRH
jgi:hypothetical protein